MKLPYTDEIITSPDQAACRVLDTAQVSFADAARGRKTAETLIRKAKGGEEIITRNNGKIESTYIAQAGDAIFINLHDQNDAYVPGNADGTRWKYEDLAEKGYMFVKDDAANNGSRMKNMQSFPILHEAIEMPTCIKDAWGPGQHVFLYAGATLKLNDNGSISGIDKTAFDNTWETLSSQPAAKAKGPAPGK